MEARNLFKSLLGVFLRRVCKLIETENLLKPWRFKRMKLITGVHVLQQKKTASFAPQNGVDCFGLNALSAGFHFPFQMVVKFLLIQAVGVVTYEGKLYVHKLFKQVFGIRVVNLRGFERPWRGVVHQPAQNFDVGRLVALRISGLRVIFLYIEQIVGTDVIVRRVGLDIIDDSLQFGGPVADIKLGIQSFYSVVIQHHSFKQLVLLGLLVVNIGTQARKGVVDGNRVQPDLFKTVFRRWREFVRQCGHSRVMLYGVTLDVRHLKTKPLLPWSEMSVPQILPTELRILFLPFFITGTTFLMAPIARSSSMSGSFSIYLSK